VDELTGLMSPKKMTTAIVLWSAQAQAGTDALLVLSTPHCIVPPSGPAGSMVFCVTVPVFPPLPSAAACHKLSSWSVTSTSP
jgi:hypothetical protein